MGGVLRARDLYSGNGKIQQPTLLFLTLASVVRSSHSSLGHLFQVPMEEAVVGDLCS